MKHPALIQGSIPPKLVHPCPISGHRCGKLPAPQITGTLAGYYQLRDGLPLPGGHPWPGRCSSLVRNGVFTTDGEWGGKFSAIPRQSSLQLLRFGGGALTCRFALGVSGSSSPFLYWVTFRYPVFPTCGECLGLGLGRVWRDIAWNFSQFLYAFVCFFPSLFIE